MRPQTPLEMPTMMMAFYPQEYVITPQTTYVLINNADHGRRIFTECAYPGWHGEL